MGHFKDTDNSSSELSVETIIRGVLTLEQGQAKKTLAAIQKGLENLVAQHYIYSSAAKEFRQMKAKILEKETEMVKIINSKKVSCWEEDRALRQTTSKELREWCCNGKHVRSIIYVSNWLIPSSSVHQEKWVSVIRNETGELVPELFEFSPCNCKSTGQIPIMEVKIGNIPAGFIPEEIAKKLDLYRKVEKGEIFVVAESIRSSDANHKADAFCYEEGEAVSDEQVLRGVFLKNGEKITLAASIDVGGGNYKQGNVTVVNQKGKAIKEENAGPISVLSLSDSDHAYPYFPVEYDPKRDGKPKYRDFCPRHRYSEWEEYAYAVCIYMEETGDIGAGWEAIKENLGWVDTNNEAAFAMAIIAADLHNRGEDVITPLEEAGEDVKLREILSLIKK